MSRHPLEECFFGVLPARGVDRVIDVGMEQAVLADLRVPRDCISKGEYLRVTCRTAARPSLPPPSSQRDRSFVEPALLTAPDPSSLESRLIRVSAWLTLNASSDEDEVYKWVIAYLRLVVVQMKRQAKLQGAICYLPQPLGEILLHLLALMRKRGSDIYDAGIKRTDVMNSLDHEPDSSPPSSSSSVYVLPSSETTPKLILVRSRL